MTTTSKVNNSNENYRKIYAEATGCEVPKNFDVHHIDFNRQNNDIQNLVALPKELHQRYHESLLYIHSPVKLITKVQSSIQPGHMYNNFTSDKIAEFTAAFDECVKWVDFRNHLLGMHQDFHMLRSTYLNQ